MTTDIIAAVNQNPVAVLLDEKTYSEFYNRVKEEISSHIQDVSTDKGRKEIASLAYKVTRSKTAIDAAGKKLNEDARSQINAVDAQRRKIREELDALADEVRRPLTAWEDAEKARSTKAKEIRETVVSIGNSSPNETPQDIRDRIDRLAEIILSGDILGDEYFDAVADRDASLAHLNAHLERAVRAEDDAAELARLRAEAEAREAAEIERLDRERAAKEQAEREEREKAEYEANVKRQAEAAERAQKEALDREAKAVETSRLEAERVANERIAKAEAEAKRIKDEAERAERVRLDEIERTKREEAARQADRAHRGEIMRQAKEAIMAQGADEETAKKIVLAIVAGEVPNVKVNF